MAVVDMVKVTWTKARRALVEAYVADLKVQLRLADWTILIDWDEPALEGALAQILPTFGQKRATLIFGPEFLTQSDDDVRQTLCHELLHAHLFELQETVRAVIDQVDGEAAQALAWRVVNQQVELATDALADAFAPLAPPIEFRAGKAPTHAGRAPATSRGRTGTGYRAVAAKTGGATRTRLPSF